MCSGVAVGEAGMAAKNIPRSHAKASRRVSFHPSVHLLPVLTPTFDPSPARIHYMPPASATPRDSGPTLPVHKGEKWDRNRDWNLEGGRDQARRGRLFGEIARLAAAQD